MKNIILSLVFFLPFFLSAQNDYDYQVTVLDSFLCDGTQQAGMAGLRAIEHNGAIHMTYAFQDITTEKKLMYGIKTADGFTTEQVVLIPGLQMSRINTALQFDANGDPHIYVAGNVDGVSERFIMTFVKGDPYWEIESTIYGGYTPYLVADVDGSNGLGFAFWSPNSTTASGQITYASFEGDEWVYTDLSSDIPYQRTKPSVVNHNGKTYVAYGEGRCSDTLITRVHVLENGIWSLDYEDLHLTTYNCGGIGGLYTKLGKSEEGVHLLYTLRTQEGSGHPYYVKNDGAGWLVQPIDYQGSLSSFINSPNLVSDEDQTLFWTNEANGYNPNLSWIKKNGEGGIIDLPHVYHSIWLYDLVVKNNFAYIYYWEGAAGFPYGTPVTFKEVKVDLGTVIISGTQAPLLSLAGFVLKQNTPNPFDQMTTLHFTVPHASMITIKVFDEWGREIETLVNSRLLAGSYQRVFNGGDIAVGNYYCVLYMEGESVVKKMILLR